ncbi:MAG: 2-C-methyl-D-erythritol 2,4-cyclodiphosphate synthase [Vampirovibrionales bacterium]|nr:2-C-methyl-D-erythritol 2,4-cyclodiphosphate synthase [Vampirovibrionales bacterium]
MKPAAAFRVGQGFDWHRLAEGLPFRLGGVTLESPVGAQAHSDGDALLHALTDAILGALALGDIGDFFPPSDPQWRDADSALFVNGAMRQAQQRGYELINVDATVFLEAPKLGPYKRAMAQTIAQLLQIEDDCVSVKAKTAEQLGPLGRCEAVAASVTVLMMTTTAAISRP